jgi:hypothetical protein
LSGPDLTRGRFISGARGKRQRTIHVPAAILARPIGIESANNQRAWQ